MIVLEEKFSFKGRKAKQMSSKADNKSVHINKRVCWHDMKLIWFTHTHSHEYTYVHCRDSGFCHLKLKLSHIHKNDLITREHRLLCLPKHNTITILPAVISVVQIKLKRTIYHFIFDTLTFSVWVSLNLCVKAHETNRCCTRWQAVLMYVSLSHSTYAICFELPCNFPLIYAHPQPCNKGKFQYPHVYTLSILITI